MTALVTEIALLNPIDYSSRVGAGQGPLATEDGREIRALHPPTTTSKGSVKTPVKTSVKNTVNT